MGKTWGRLNSDTRRSIRVRVEVAGAFCEELFDLASSVNLTSGYATSHHTHVVVQMRLPSRRWRFVQTCESPIADTRPEPIEATVAQMAQNRPLMFRKWFHCEGTFSHIVFTEW